MGSSYIFLSRLLNKSGILEEGISCYSLSDLLRPVR